VIVVRDGLAIVGGGKIGEALLSGLLRGHYARDEVVVVEKHPQRAAYLTATHGVRAVDVAEAAARAIWICAFSSCSSVTWAANR
jgi:pyrroline-5-carboxylate reductase